MGILNIKDLVNTTEYTLHFVGGEMVSPGDQCKVTVHTNLSFTIEDIDSSKESIDFYATDTQIIVAPFASPKDNIKDPVLIKGLKYNDVCHVVNESSKVVLIPTDNSQVVLYPNYKTLFLQEYKILSKKHQKRFGDFDVTVTKGKYSTVTIRDKKASETTRLV